MNIKGDFNSDVDVAVVADEVFLSSISNSLTLSAMIPSHKDGGGRREEYMFNISNKNYLKCGQNINGQ